MPMHQTPTPPAPMVHHDAGLAKGASSPVPNPKGAAAREIIAGVNTLAGVGAGGVIAALPAIAPAALAAAGVPAVWPILIGAVVILSALGRPPALADLLGLLGAGAGRKQP